MKFGKKQLILSALVVALGAAVYLNWHFTDSQGLLSATSTASQAGKELGRAQYATASVSSKSDSKDKKTASSSSDKSVSSKAEEKATAAMSESYFKEAEDNRDEAQEKIVQIATEVLKNTESDDKARTAAVKQAADLTSAIQQQSNVESLIKAKGFTNCIAYIQNGECSIVVNKGVLSEALAVSIKDIVNSQTGIAFDKIKITEV